jgi:hypothetical protein
MLIIFTPNQILFLLTVFELLPETAILPLCSIYRHGGHDGWSAGSSDANFKENPLRMIQAKFGLNWPSGFRGEDSF